MNKWKQSVALTTMVLLLGGCGMNPFANGDDTPEDVDTEIREKYYEDFVSMYETYETHVEEADGSFLDENGDVIQFDGGTFGDTGEILEDAAEGTKRQEEEGGELILNEAEDTLYTDMLSLSLLRGLDGFTEDMQQDFWDNNPELVANDVEESLIQVEEKIIDTLDLDKASIELLRAEEAEAVAEQEAKEAAEQEQQEQAKAEQEAAEVQAQAEKEQAQAQAPSNADIEGEVSSNGTSSNQDINYDPDYMGQDEWETCTGTEAYTIQECIGWDQSYAYGEGREELMAGDDPDNYVMGTLDRAREGWDNDDGNYEQAYEAGKEVVKDFYEDRNEIEELTFSAFETLRVEDIMRDDEGNIIINTVVGIKKGLEEEPEFVPYRVEMTEELEYRYLYMPDDHYYEELDGSY